MTVIDIIAVLIFLQFIVIVGYCKFRKENSITPSSTYVYFEFVNFDGYFHLARNSKYEFKFYTNADNIVTQISNTASPYLKVYYLGGDSIIIKTFDDPLYYYKNEDIMINAYKKGSPALYKNYLVVID